MDSNKKKKYAMLGVASLFMVMAVSTATDHGSVPSRKTEEIHRERKLLITKTAVSIICASTDYKEDCTSSLQTVRSPDPWNLIRSVFDLAISSIRSGVEEGMVDLKSRADANVRTRDAVITCRELMDDAIDDLLKTRETITGLFFTRLSDFVEDLCVWLSASITYQQTCIDGFEGIDSEAAVVMKRVMRKGQHLTSNGLAIVSNLDNLLKVFHIPIPFLGSSRGPRFGLLGPQDPPSDSSEDHPPISDSARNPPSDSSENQRSDSARNPPSYSSENQRSDSPRNPPSDSYDDPPNKKISSNDGPLNAQRNQRLEPTEDSPQKSVSSKNRPLDSSQYAPKNMDSSENQETDSPNKSNSPMRPLDPLGKLNPLRHLSEKEEFPRWLPMHSRRLLRARVRNIRANAVVAKDGSGRFKTITQALAMVPKKNKRKFVIYIKQGVYREKVEVTKKMHHVMFIGDGPTKTIITGDVAFLPNRIGTFRTSTVAVNGDYFMAKDIGFQNTAGAARHQAVALRVSADFAVFFNCRMDAYQDTLYVHTHRQFYRDCRISGTIDFVFGDAKAVFQNCDFVIRRPMEHQQCIVTAQGRKDKRETTGIVIHNSRIMGDRTYRPVKAKNRAFLGRPWKEYSRTIIMNTEIDDVIDPEGWLKWNETFALNTLFYSEYRNRGRGSGQARRVRWRGIRRISDRDARQFTPGNFLRGSTWIPQTRIPYNAN